MSLFSDWLAAGACLEGMIGLEAPMQPPAVLDLKAFVPAKDYALSKRFYSDLGFQLAWSNEQVTEFEVGTFRFLLQNYYLEEYAKNFMMQLTVQNVEAWWKHISGLDLPSKYPGILAKPPQMQPWGIRVLYLSDPSGVLWHIAEQKS